MQGLFISFEGIDGAGKSTHIQAVANALQAQGRAVRVTREPGGTPLAEDLRALMLGQAMDPLTEALLMFAARRDHIVQVIAPALARGEAVVSDRFADASFAYQGGGRGLAWDTLQALEDMTLATADGPLQPQLTLWFDLPPAVAAERLAGVRVPDRFESQPLAFFETVRQAYARRAAAAPERFVRIEADAAPEPVRRDVLAALQQRGWL